jgi:hypothetical protein
MASSLRRYAAALALGAILLAPAAGRASTNIDNVGDKGSPPSVDLFIMRPLGLAMLGVSCALFVPAAALTMLVRHEEIGVPYEHMVAKPARFVFVDPLGSH